jgi:hypothetical protein
MKVQMLTFNGWTFLESEWAPTVSHPPYNLANLLQKFSQSGSHAIKSG